MTEIKTGHFIRLPHWTSCYMVVHDIGEETLWGAIWDPATGQMVDRCAMPLNLPWEDWDTSHLPPAEQVIKNLRTYRKRKWNREAIELTIVCLMASAAAFALWKIIGLIVLKLAWSR